MREIWKIVLQEASPNTQRFRWKVKIVSGDEGKAVEARGDSPAQAYRSACVKLVLKPFLDVAECCDQKKAGDASNKNITELQRGNTSLIEALMDMVAQHCINNGDQEHLIYSAGGLSANEAALDLLEEAGYAKDDDGKGVRYHLLYEKLEARKQAEA